MAKRAKARDAEQVYIKRARGLRNTTTAKRTRTPWTEFFSHGVGAELETSIPKSSVHSTVYSYGRRLGKKFVCSYEEHNGMTLVKLKAVERRD